MSESTMSKTEALGHLGRVGSGVVLGSATIGTDRPRKRGEVCRGAYIADVTGALYLTHRGTWTYGIQGDDNWWLDDIAAGNFLAGLINKAQEPNEKADLPPTRDVNRDSGTDSANGG